jgi:hypothetical protein
MVVYHGKLYFGHVKPTPLLWRVTDFRLVPQPFRFFRRKGFVQAGYTIWFYAS